MPLRFAPEPANGIAHVIARLRRISAQASVYAPEFADVDSLQLSPPHAVYDLPLAEVLNGAGLESAKASGIRYLVQANGNAVAAADVREHNGRLRVVNVNAGRYVGASANALQYLAALAEVQAGSYEARLLRCSAIFVWAIWLKFDDGDDDIIYPFGPAPKGIEMETSYAIDGFLAAIRPMSANAIK